MKTMNKLIITAALATIVASSTVAKAEEADTSGFKFQAGLTYISGMNKLGDAIEENNPYYNVSTLLPVGLSLNAGYELNNGLGLGLSLGPAAVGLGDASFFVVPVGADVRYTFLRDKAVSPYVRGGVEYAFAGGDFITGSSVGFVGAAGVEFGHSKDIAWGIEAGYNSAEVEVEATFGHPAIKVKPMEFFVSAFIRF